MNKYIIENLIIETPTIFDIECYIKNGEEFKHNPNRRWKKEHFIFLLEQRVIQKTTFKKIAEKVKSFGFNIHRNHARNKYLSAVRHCVYHSRTCKCSYHIWKRDTSTNMSNIENQNTLFKENL